MRKLRIGQRVTFKGLVPQEGNTLEEEIRNFEEGYSRQPPEVGEVGTITEVRPSWNRDWTRYVVSFTGGVSASFDPEELEVS